MFLSRQSNLVGRFKGESSLYLPVVQVQLTDAPWVQLFLYSEKCCYYYLIQCELHMISCYGELFWIVKNTEMKKIKSWKSNNQPAIYCMRCRLYCFSCHGKLVGHDRAMEKAKQQHQIQLYVWWKQLDSDVMIEWKNTFISCRDRLQKLKSYF